MIVTGARHDWSMSYPIGPPDGGPPASYCILLLPIEIVDLEDIHVPSYCRPAGRSIEISDLGSLLLQRRNDTFLMNDSFETIDLSFLNSKHGLKSDTRSNAISFPSYMLLYSSKMEYDDSDP